MLTHFSIQKSIPKKNSVTFPDPWIEMNFEKVPSNSEIPLLLLVTITSSICTLDKISLFQSCRKW